MNFLKTEILKNIKLKHWQLLLVLCILISFLKAYNFSTNGFIELIIAKADPNFKNAYFVFYRLYFTILNLGFPFIVTILCYSSIIFIEERYNMWVFHATRAYYRELHLYKIFSIYIFLAIFIAVSFFSSMIGIKLHMHNVPNIFLANKPENFLLEGILFAKFFFCAMGIISLHYIIILFFPLKRTRLAVGVFLPYIMCLLPSKINPYSFLFQNNDEAFKIRKISVNETDYDISKISFIDKHVCISLTCIVFSLLLIWKVSNKYKRFLTS